MNVCDFFYGNYMKNEQRYDYDPRTDEKPIPVFGGGLIYFHIAKSIFESCAGTRAGLHDIDFSQFYLSFKEGSKEVTKLTFPLSGLDMQEPFNDEERIIIFPTSKLIPYQEHYIWISKQQDGLWDVELSSSENGSWHRYYLGNFYFKKDLDVFNRFVRKRMIRIGNEYI